ncbi:hypothetical protein FNV43_RR10703 [Rhamnella rubrinervis]|uniref:DPH4 homolog n=1 Tax=Rhamnella rubrinervis TaxID=2594499 RepID=A0A8K0H4C3_9ROSA|nr:hypothetical protein FNV43_RR10703 [Rhamnella rubrinervis]
MLCCKNSIQETHYHILSVKEDAAYEEIRASYRSALLNSHPDKLQNASEVSHHENEEGASFLKVQKAWEILSNSKSRALYDLELQSLIRDTMAAEDVSLEDMMVEDVGDAIELFHQCRCGDYYSVDSLELEKMGFPLLKNGSTVSLETRDSNLPAAVVLPCGSCSLEVRLLINSDSYVSITDNSL